MFSKLEFPSEIKNVFVLTVSTLYLSVKERFLFPLEFMVCGEFGVNIEKSQASYLESAGSSYRAMPDALRKLELNFLLVAQPAS